MPAQVYSRLDRLFGWLLPPRCVLCRGPGLRPGFDLCRPCADDLPWMLRPCRRCGMPTETMPCPQKPVDGCAHCSGTPQPYRRCFAPFLYEFPLSQMILDLKYEAALANARVLGTLLADALVRQQLPGTVDAVVPLPLHAERRVERGFNQSHEIARFVARRLGLPCETQWLRRVRATRPQVGLARAERLDNLRDAFRAQPHAIAGRRIALLDDVVTTGSTAAEAARALLAAGATVVDVWAVARAPG